MSLCSIIVQPCLLPKTLTKQFSSNVLSTPRESPRCVISTRRGADAWCRPRGSLSRLSTLVIAGVTQEVNEGTNATRAYEAMMYGAERSDADAIARWRQLLLQYCELDTLGMVLVFEHWRRLTGLA